MTEARTRKYRKRHAAEQQHRCFYCSFPMWVDDGDGFARRHGISRAEAKRFQCTAEHLKALQDGGTSRVDNIVAACRFCNQNRHRRPVPAAVEPYRSLVRKRVARQSWHPLWLHKLLGAQDTGPSH